MDPPRILSVPPEIFDKIYSLLEPIYKVLFAMCCKKIYYDPVFTHPDLCKIILLRGGFIVKAAVAYGGAITGGFILDCLFGTNYASDIDIVFDIGKGVSPEWKQYTAFWNTICGFITDMGTDTLCKRLENEQSDTICIVRKFRYNNTRIDLIKCPSGIENYVSQFDFDFCRVLFDGKLKLLCPHAVIQKESRMYNNTYDVTRVYLGHNRIINNSINVLRRCQKYTTRGFKILE